MYIHRSSSVKRIFFYNMNQCLKSEFVVVLVVCLFATGESGDRSAPCKDGCADAGLCEEVRNDTATSFISYPGSCSKFLLCIKALKIKPLVRTCPFGQFWDADAIACRPSFLVNCPADPCKASVNGFTYGMAEGRHGCRAYWQCIDDFSVGHCCPIGSAYVEGMGCLENALCNEECPPGGGLRDKQRH